MGNNRNTASSYMMANTGKVVVQTHGKKKGVTFDPDVPSDDDVKSDNESNGKYVRNRGLSRRQSIWDGVLDIDNVIMMPENTRIWRPRLSIHQNAIVQESLLDSITKLITPNSFKKNNKIIRDEQLWDEIMHTSTDAMILYLPFLCVITTKLKQNQTYQNKLKNSIIKRCQKDEDIKQSFQFFMNSYKNCSEITKIFSNDLKLLANQTNNNNNSNNDNGWESIKNRDQSSASISTVASNATNKSRDKVIIEQKSPQSAISLFETILNKKIVGNTEIICHKNNNVRDPISSDAPPLSRIDVRKVIPSATKPLLIDCYVSNKSNNFEYLSSTIILKKGDDLRVDSAVLHIFRLMNKIWRESDLNFMQIPIRAFTYKTIPISNNIGCIELIPQCKPLRVVNSLSDTITIGQQFNLIASGVGSYIATFCLGIRDRHYDNVLIRHSDCTIFHIDFGYILGESPSVDTSKFSITKDLKELMGVYWDKFIELSVEAYLALRERYKELIKFARLSFDQIIKGDKIEKFLINQLHINDKNDSEAARYIAQKIKDSPDSVKTKFKNVMHGIAQMTKK